MERIQIRNVLGATVAIIRSNTVSRFFSFFWKVKTTNSNFLATRKVVQTIIQVFQKKKTNQGITFLLDLTTCNAAQTIMHVGRNIVFLIFYKNSLQFFFSIKNRIPSYT